WRDDGSVFEELGYIDETLGVGAASCRLVDAEWKDDCRRDALSQVQLRYRGAILIGERDDAVLHLPLGSGLRACRFREWRLLLFGASCFGTGCERKRNQEGRDTHHG